MEGIVEIEAGEDGEDIGLQHRDQDFEGGGQKFKSPFQTFDVLVGATYHF